MYSDSKQKMLDCLWDDHISRDHPDRLTLMDMGIGRPVYESPSVRNGWTWAWLKEASPFKVEQYYFPTTNSGHVLQGPTPCTDGETLWIPTGSFDSQVSFLLHEMAHAFLHYPNGKDEGLIDPMPRSESVWEAEACLTACKSISTLGLVDIYNKGYLRFWRGEYGDINFQKVAAVSSRIASTYQHKRNNDEIRIGGR